jgi:DNA-binding winged helix-turn-helix (wHTH) protein/predicted negative regulator of RcsB-dependent stress response
MALYKFDDFVFDSERFKLMRRGKQLPLRPKALQLLNLLIQNREKIVSKQEILLSVWGSIHARDHQLFQLISELRKSPFKTDFVRTQPNEGYQWNVSTVRLSKKLSLPLKIAASIMLSIGCISGASYVMLQDSSKNSTVRMPALNAFSKGIVAMDAGQSDQAIEWFKFALNENPDSVESSLFLAETLFQQDNTEESFEQLQALLQKPNLDTYNKMTAKNLLSRIRQRQGRFLDALIYAQESSKSGVVAQCSVDVVTNRIDHLMGGYERTLTASKVLEKTEASKEGDKVPNLEKYNEKCHQLKLDASETSYCEPDFEGRFYVNREYFSVYNFS